MTALLPRLSSLAAALLMLPLAALADFKKSENGQVLRLALYAVSVSTTDPGEVVIGLCYSPTAVEPDLVLRLPPQAPTAATGFGHVSTADRHTYVVRLEATSNEGASTLNRLLSGKYGHGGVIDLLTSTLHAESVASPKDYALKGGQIFLPGVRCTVASGEVREVVLQVSLFMDPRTRIMAVVAAPLDIIR